ncbi:hypothetical protein BT69DRAFT_1283577, partial [Atractiella rhizophila]
MSLFLREGTLRSSPLIIFHQQRASRLYFLIAGNEFLIKDHVQFGMGLHTRKLHCYPGL